MDREDELSRVREALVDPGARLVLYGERRLGKSSVLHEAVRAARGSGHAATLVSFATASSEAEAAQRVLQALRAEIGHTWRDLLDDLSRALDLRLELTPDPASGQPSVRLRFTRGTGGAPPRVLAEVLDVIHARLEADGGRLGLCIDEFQRIHEWGGEDAEWALREAIQGHPRLSYVFAGSRRSLIEAMVSGKGRALWKQADVLPFGPIPRETLARWIWSRTRATGGEISRAAAERVVDLAWPRTRDVVQLARATWPGPGGEATPDAAEAAFERLVEEQAALYERIWRSLGAREQDVLRVFAAAERAEDVQITAADTLARFDLGPKSTVMSAVGRLVDSEVLVSVERGYAFDDPFFRRWVQRHAVPDLGLPTPPLRRAATP